MDQDSEAVLQVTGGGSGIGIAIAKHAIESRVSSGSTFTIHFPAAYDSD